MKSRFCKCRATRTQVRELIYTQEVLLCQLFNMLLEKEQRQHPAVVSIEEHLHWTLSKLISLSLQIHCKLIKGIVRAFDRNFIRLLNVFFFRRIFIAQRIKTIFLPDAPNYTLNDNWYIIIKCIYISTCYKTLSFKPLSAALP